MRETSTRRRGKSRLTWVVALLPLCGGMLPAATPPQAQTAGGPQIEVVATGLLRPVQLAFEASGRLVVLCQGLGDAAGEIVWLDLAGRLPVDAARIPRVVVPFSDPSRQTALGSLAVDPKSGGVVLGEENGNRIYRLTDKRLTPLVVGLNHLLGGSSFVMDRQGRLVVLDDASFYAQLRSEALSPPAMEALGVDEYQGPLVVRIDLDEDVPLPRRADLIPPLFPRASARRAGGERPLRFIALAPTGDDELALLNWGGEIFLLSRGELRRLGRLPPGQLNRTSMALAKDGSILVSGGFHIREVYRVAPDGSVSSFARELSDPQGIAVDRSGAVYVAEAARHRIIRIRPRDP